MVKSVIASLGVFATTVSALGSAVVVNQCPYSVFLCDVPASGGGFEQSEHTLQSGGKWSQQWTELTNAGGWSIKLSKDPSLSNIMQYEYTYQTVTPNIIWYDLSDVNGNPWTGDWEVNADISNCNPKDQAYRFATDDAYGMQSCPSDATITVTLCSGSSSGSGSSSDSSAAPKVAATTIAVPSYTAPAVKPITEAAAPTTQTTQAQTTQEVTTQQPITQQQTTVQAPVSTEAPSSTQQPATTAAAPVFSGPWIHWGLGPDGAVVSEDDDLPAAADALEHAVAAPSHTTFATSVSSIVTEVAGVTVTHVDTAVVTEVVTAIAGRLGRRHEHGNAKHRHHHNA